MLLACVLIGEYLSENEEIPTLYVRNRMGKTSLAELTLEGSNEFQWMYRMEYSTILKLCTIICPQVQVDD